MFSMRFCVNSPAGIFPSFSVDPSYCIKKDCKAGCSSCVDTEDSTIPRQQMSCEREQLR
ncbi:hypothetical protein COCON_G00028840, partial [Conger conger]